MRERADAMLASVDGDWPEPAESGRDWKKIVLIVGLGVLSWVATYVGMLELIEANMGELPLIHKVITGFSVAMLMTMIVWLLDQLFAPLPFATKVAYALGYVFLSLISIGFGFGFYWKVLESRSEATRSAESAVSQVQTSLHAAATRLEQLQSTLQNLTALSTQKAEMERANGTSCPGSRPGDGPRRALREADAQRFAFASDLVKNRVGSVKAEMASLEADFVKLASNDATTIDAKSGTRNEFMKGLGRKLDLTVAGFNAFRTDPQLKQIRGDLADRAEKTTFPDTRGTTFSCPDPQLQTALRGVVRAIDQLPELEKPKIAAVEGSEATIEAFRRLTATFTGLLTFKLPPSADELRALQQKAVQSVEQAGTARPAVPEQPGLSKRDYIPLAVAIFVDLCLLLVSMGRPMNRLHGLVPKMRAAERGPVYQILSKFSDIHADRETRAKFEVFRHVVFDYFDTYYVAVPLEAPRYRMVERFEVVRSRMGGTREVARAYREPLTDTERDSLRDEAHLLANLFASFEREGIFQRIDSRFLGKLTRTEPTVEAARVRLRRQGSKFAESTAFRLYRFQDGAWPEIILGAVMGAARRVEAEKRRRRLSDMLSAADGPPADGPVLPDMPSANGETRRPVDATEPVRPTVVRPSEPDERTAAFGRYARYVDEPAPAAPRAREADGAAEARPRPAEARPVANVVSLPRAPLTPTRAYGEAPVGFPVGAAVAAAAEPRFATEAVAEFTDEFAEPEAGPAATPLEPVEEADPAAALAAAFATLSDDAGMQTPENTPENMQERPPAA